jgi:hypothetical protein
MAGAWTAVLGLLAGAALVLLLYSRRLGRRRFALGLTSIGTVAITCLDLCLLSNSESATTQPSPFARQKPPVDPTTQEERCEVARYFADEFHLSLPILVDSIDDKAEAAYTAMPERIYVIDADGKVAYKGGPGPGGFHVAEVPAVLDRLLDRTAH